MTKCTSVETEILTGNTAHELKQKVNTYLALNVGRFLIDIKYNVVYSAISSTTYSAMIIHSAE